MPGERAGGPLLRVHSEGAGCSLPSKITRSVCLNCKCSGHQTLQNSFLKCPQTILPPHRTPGPATGGGTGGTSGTGSGTDGTGGTSPGVGGTGGTGNTRPGTGGTGTKTTTTSHTGTGSFHKSTKKKKPPGSTPRHDPTKRPWPTTSSGRTPNKKGKTKIPPQSFPTKRPPITRVTLPRGGPTTTKKRDTTPAGQIRKI